MKKIDTVSWWLYGIGITIILVTHVYMLVAGMTEDQVVGHAVINLIAAALLAGGWFKRK